MKIRKTIMMICLGIAGSLTAAHAQGEKNVTVTQSEIRRNMDRFEMEFGVDYNRLVINPNEQLIVTPIIIRATDTTALRPVVFTGRNMARVEKRHYELGNDTYINDEPYETVVFSRRDMKDRRRELESSSYQPSMDNVVVYSYSVPYQPWMQDSRLVLRQEYVDCQDMSTTYLTSVGRIATPAMPLVMIVAPVYPVPYNTEFMTAFVNFPVDRYELNRNFMRNEQEIERITAFTQNIMNNPDAEVRTIRITGYASPEAPYSYNDRLASNRVETVKNAVKQRFNFPDEVFEVSHVAEDWDSLRSWVARSDVQYKDDLLRIIDNTADPDARDRQIRALDNSRTYNMLLRNVYPELRRVDYSIDYDGEPYTQAALLQMFRTNPESMQIAHFYMLADSYDRNSPEWEEVYTVAQRLNPDDVVACNNAAAAAIRNGDHQKAMQILERVKDDPRCLNNLAIVYLRNGDTLMAEELFKRAADQGSSEAAQNLENLAWLQ